MKRIVVMVTLFLLVICQPAQAVNIQGLQALLKQQEMRLHARIGMSIVDAQGQPVFGYRQHDRFPLTSTFKVLACAALLDSLHQKAGSLEEKLTLQPGALLDYSPVTRDYLPPAAISLGTLCKAAVSYSDNTAANRILTYLGGPDAVTRFMRANGDQLTRLDRTEPTLNEARPGDVRDTTTPESMTVALHTLLATSLLTPPHRETLHGWMRDDKVADALLRAALPSGWDIADKTGAGGNGSRAIIAAVTPPEEPPFYLAIYITQTGASMKQADSAIASIGRHLFR
ncbi:class A beta-lactamase [Biostraticola tofi]|uniref:Beta-lactamase n=1 Tax=Biostraticola tofi TaxID=466109 RepID=A0A4R3YZF8_9GAMM|nr:class A beta-lactamase [Biostraticola tofi]TCV98712.1 beta-lactamase class A [Biostraticola tofi]